VVWGLTALRFALPLLVLLGLAGCDPSNVQVTHYLEVKCEADFDPDMKCQKALRPGAELEVRVNLTTQKVQITITKNDGSWLAKHLFLDTCSVIDGSNWKCENVIPAAIAPITQTYAAIRGRFYHSVTSRVPPNYYSSSISGLALWAYHWQLITFEQAFKWSG
jgi:hypothetical protein